MLFCILLSSTAMAHYASQGTLNNRAPLNVEPYIKTFSPQHASEKKNLSAHSWQTKQGAEKRKKRNFEHTEQAKKK
jgi:hypothetical protein